MKRLLLFILMLCSFAPAFSEEKVPYSLENQLYKQSVQIDYLSKTLKDTEKELEKIKADERNMYEEHTESTRDDIFWYSVIITLVIGGIVGVIGIAVPLFINHRFEKDIKAKILEITKLKDIADKQSVNIQQLETDVKAFAETAKKDSELAIESAKEAKAYSLFSEALREEDVTRQIELYTVVIRLKSDFVEAYNNRGDAYNKQGDYDKAITDFNEAIRFDSNFAESYYNRGNSYSNKDDYGNGIVDYTDAIRLKPEYIGAYTNRGIAYAKQSYYDKAIADFNKAIKLESEDAQVYINRGQAYFMQGNYGNAIFDYNEGIRLGIGTGNVYLNRGVAYFKQGDYDNAMSDYNEAIKLNPDFMEVYNNRGATYTKQGDYDNAISEYNEAIRLKYDCIEAYSNRCFVSGKLAEQATDPVEKVKYEELAKADKAMVEKLSQKEQA